MPLRSSLAMIGLVSVTASPATRPARRASPRPVLVWRREEPDDNRLSFRDRMTLLGWEAEARHLGVSRVVIERPEPDLACPEVGDFALIYDDASEWARWAVAREAGMYLLWSPSRGETLGRFATLAAALARIGSADC